MTVGKQMRNGQFMLYLLLCAAVKVKAVPRKKSQRSGYLRMNITAATAACYPCRIRRRGGGTAAHENTFTAR